MIYVTIVKVISPDWPNHCVQIYLTDTGGFQVLKAVLHGKAGRIEAQSAGTVSWRDMFKSREDLLTSAFFSRFHYLSNTIQLKLLRSWLSKAPDQPGTLESIEYWPSYHRHSGNEKNRVEPDVVMRFNNANVLVEVKPPTGAGQYLEQWCREVDAFLQSDEEYRSQFHFLALGQLNVAEGDKWAAELKSRYQDKVTSVSMVSWKTVVKTIIDIQQDKDILASDTIIVHDILEALQLYGLNTSTFHWDDFLGRDDVGKNNEVITRISLGGLKGWNS